jgi:Tfp pilus assembly PilM family ATPase
MGKRADSVIGLDLGKHVFKGVSLRQKGDSRLVLTNFARHQVPEEIGSADELARHLKPLLRELGGAKVCAVGVSDPAALLRIVEQPDTPVDLLRNALRWNGLAVLNQECKDFVLDVAPVSANAGANGGATESAGNIAVQSGVVTKTRYVVGGLLRERVKQIAEAMNKARLPAQTLQLAPVCSFNAFEVAYPEIFNHEAFLLLDLGHLQSTVLIGSKAELVLVRSIEYGGQALGYALTAEEALDKEAAWLLIQQADPGMVDVCRASLARLATEVRNSIGFFEGQREESIFRIFVSGGLARFETILQTLSDELSLPCEIWDPLETCEVALPAAKREALPHEFVSLNVACGAAFEYFRS